MTVQDTVRRFTFQRVSCEAEVVWQAGYFSDRERDSHGTFDRHFGEMLAAFKAGQSPPVPVEAGRRALVVAHVETRASETGRRVETPAIAQRIRSADEKFRTFGISCNRNARNQLCENYRATFRR